MLFRYGIVQKLETCNTAGHAMMNSNENFIGKLLFRIYPNSDRVVQMYYFFLVKQKKHSWTSVWLLKMTAGSNQLSQ